MDKIENKEMCSVCGGKCCIKSGCDYAPRDFKSLGINDLYKKLEEGNISIVAAIIFRKVKEKMLVEPFLYLRARNTNRDVVDLLSMKTTCSMLRDNKCFYSYEERPAGGVNLVPRDYGEKCFPKEDPRKIIREWERYQKPLGRLVKRFTGKSVDEKFREDVEQLFYDILSENYDGVADIEIEDIKSMILQLSVVYEEEYYKAVKRYDDERKLLVKRV